MNGKWGMNANIAMQLFHTLKTNDFFVNGMSGKNGGKSWIMNVMCPALTTFVEEQKHLKFNSCFNSLNISRHREVCWRGQGRVLFQLASSEVREEAPGSPGHQEPGGTLGQVLPVSLRPGPAQRRLLGGQRRSVCNNMSVIENLSFNKYYESKL